MFGRLRWFPICPDEKLENDFPYVYKIVGTNAALKQFRSSFNIHAGIDIPITENACNIDAGAADEIMLTHDSLEFLR